jgi:hypothetical protein
MSGNGSGIGRLGVEAYYDSMTPESYTPPRELLIPEIIIISFLNVNLLLIL